jgi:signal transduction histidine kinase
VPRLRPDRAAIVDAAIALALVGSAAYDVWGRDVAATASRPLVFLLAAATLAPLARRRQQPLAVLLAVVAGVGAHTLAFGQWESFQHFVALVLAVFSVAAYADRTRATIGVAVATALWVAASAAKLAAGDPLSELFGPFVVLAAVVLGGRALARRRAEAARLTELNADLERRKEADALAAVEAERARIARELHDVVAHAVSVIVVQAQAAGRVLEGEQTSARESLNAIESTARTALVEMRRLLELLRPEDGSAGLVPQPGLDQLGALVDQVREAGLDVDLCVEGERRAIPAGVDLSAFRIVQEALTNVLKHAGPARAAVTLRYRSGEIELEVVDDGAAAPRGGRGHGLLGMRERAAVVGGRVETGPRAEAGYAVRATLPT